MQGNTELYPPLNVTEFSFVVAAMLLSILAMTVLSVMLLMYSWRCSLPETSNKRAQCKEYQYRHRVSTDLAEIVREHVEVKMRLDGKLQLGEDDVTECLLFDVRRKLLQEV